MVASASIKLDELLISWLGSDALYKSVMRLIDQQKESNNKRALSNILPPSIATATTAAALDSKVGNLSTTTTSRRGRSPTLAVPHLPGKGGGAAAMEEAAMIGAEYDRSLACTSSSSCHPLSLWWQRRGQPVRKDTIHIMVSRVVDEGGRRRRRLVVDNCVNGGGWQQRAASSPVVIGGGKAIVGGQWTIAGCRSLVGRRITSCLSASYPEMSISMTKNNV
jgi:hypothetical protein